MPGAVAALGVTEQHFVARQRVGPAVVWSVVRAKRARRGTCEEGAIRRDSRVKASDSHAALCTEVGGHCDVVLDCLTAITALSLRLFIGGLLPGPLGARRFAVIL